MKEEYVKPWVEALRSGKYEQGQQALKTEDTYCCLGVFCDLAIKNNWFPDLNLRWGEVPKEFLDEDITSRPAIFSTFSKDGDHFEAYVLPFTVIQAAGFQSSEGNFSLPLDEVGVDDKETTSLAEVNDEGHSFFYIADLIEKHWAEI